MKNFLKTFICNTSYAFNLPEYLGFFRRNKILVLMYHRILKSYSDDPLKNLNEHSISESQFEDQMAYLSHHCNVISVSDLIAGKNISQNNKNVVITFDDGYKDNFTNAFPILLKYNLPALFSISTEFVVNKTPLWFDIIEHAVRLVKKKHISIKLYDKYVDFILNSLNDKIKLLYWLRSKCFEITQENRGGFINDLINEFDIPIDYEELLIDPDYAPLSSEEIHEMAYSKMAEFAAHSVHHYLLSRVNITTLKHELLQSKSAVEYLTNSPCKYFCIPGGYYNETMINAILDTKFEVIFSSDTVEVDPQNIPVVIGRFGITRSINKGLFADIVHGPFHSIYYSLKAHKYKEI